MRAEELCLNCGACCANFRVSFHWSEADPEQGGEVPPPLTVPVDPYRVAMRGTEARPVRCVALQGDVGGCVACTIYAQRPTPCRDFAVSWANGVRNERCDQARAAWGLPPLTVEDVWGPFTGFTEIPAPQPLVVPETVTAGALLLPVDGVAGPDGHTDPPGSLPTLPAAA